MRQFLLVLMTGAIIGALLGAVTYKKDEFRKSVNTTPQEESNREAALDFYIERLAHCESRGKTTALILDVNGYNSRGLYQWQTASALYYLKKYEMLNPDWELPTDIINLLHDKDFSTKLTRKVLSGEREGWKNWLNCGKAIGLDEFMYLYHNYATTTSSTK